MNIVHSLDGEEALIELGVSSEMVCLELVIGVGGRSMGSPVWFMGVCWG